MMHRKKYTPSLEVEYKQYAWTLDFNHEQIKWNQIDIMNQQQQAQFGRKSLFTHVDMNTAMVKSGSLNTI